MWHRYANTAARTHGRPGREIRSKGVTIDIHAHAAVPAAAKFVGAFPNPMADFASAATNELNVKQEDDIRARIVEYDDRFTDMDSMGIDMQFVMPPPSQLYHSLTVDLAAAAARIINEGIAEYCERHKDRLLPCCTDPIQDGYEAAKELEFCRALGFRGVEIQTNVNGKDQTHMQIFPIRRRPISRRSISTRSYSGTSA